MGFEGILTAANGFIYLPSKTHRPPPKPNETPSIVQTQPLSMVSLFDPDKARAAVNLPPDPGPYEEPPKMPKFLKADWRNKPVPRVLRNVFGKTIKITAWMTKIALAMKENCIGQKYIDPRRFRNQFRRYVTLEKRARMQKKSQESPPPPLPPPPEFGAGEFPKMEMLPDKWE